MLAHSFFLSRALVFAPILAPSANSFSWHPCAWTLAREECTDSFEVPSLEHVLRSCKQEVFVLLSVLCLGQNWRPL